MTDNLNFVLSGIRRLCDIITESYANFGSVSFEDVADEFQRELPNLKVRDDLSVGFSVSRRLVSIGKPFDEYVSTSESKPTDSLTVGNIVDYICCLLDEMKNTARPGTYVNYNTVMCGVDEYVSTLEDKDKKIDGDFISGFAEWVKGKGLIESSISFYLRILRTIVGKAATEGLITLDNAWFKGLTTGYKPNTVKLGEQSLSKAELNRIVDADLKLAPRLDVSRNIFMFSFYCHGMELMDILNLKRTNVTGDYLVYNKRLSGQQETIVVDAPIRRIIRKYADKENDLLLNISKFYNDHTEYQSIRNIVIRDMAALFKLLGINKKFQFSMARNSWDELMKNISLSETLLS